MWSFFSKLWLTRLGRRGPAVVEAALRQTSGWRDWLAAAITNISKDKPCLAQDAAHRLKLLPVTQFLLLDEELRRAARFVDVTSSRQNFVLSPSESLPGESSAYLFTASCNSNGYVREAALTAFGNHPDRLAFAAALIRCDDWVPQVQRAASGSLSRLLESDSASLIFDLLPLLVRLRQRKRMSEEIWPQRVEPMLRSPGLRESRWNSTKSPDSETRVYAYHLVLEADSERAQEALFQASADRHPKISIWALNLAVTLLVSDVQTLIRRALRHSDSEVRAQALRLFAQFGTADLHEVLEGFLFDNSRGPRDAAVFLLDQHFKESALKHWREAIDAGASLRRNIAVAALSYAAESEDVSRLTPFLKDPSARLRAFTLRGLVRADGAHAEKYLVSALRDASAFVVRFAMSLTSKHGQLFALKDLQEAFQSSLSEATRRQLSFASRLLGKWDSLEFLLWLATVHRWDISAVGLDRWLLSANRRFTSLDENTRVRLLSQLHEVAGRITDGRWSRVEIVLRRS